MKYIIIILFPVFLLGCGTIRQPMLALMNAEKTYQTDTLSSRNFYFTEILFQSVKYNCLEFYISIKNNSADTLQINPSSFRYTPVFHKAGTSTDSLGHFIQGIDPERRINQLQNELDSLSKEVNPYSLSNKSTKEIIRDGLVTGLVATIFGQNINKLDSIREDNKEQWNNRNNYCITEAKSELVLLQNKALKPTALLPNRKIEGIIHFPVTKEAKEILMELPESSNIQSIRYKQVYIK
ncbi:hypothetical protein [uncultured Bacteroides sp.]|uniref:hypothetical protein n=1 Tax=uncultured Bacteroides sp. TaxID=162156 RepID=UPI002AA90ED8|nr:hypothetical protein [uncultured Bacteroides sp.]